MKILRLSYRALSAAFSIAIAACANPTAPSEPDPSASERGSDDDNAGQSSAGASSRALDAGTSASKPRDAGRNLPDSGHKNPVPAPAADAGTKAAETGGLPCDVQQIVDEHCGMCHGDPPSFGAPMPLTSVADFEAAAATDETKKVHQLVKTRVNAASKPMPPAGSKALTESQLSTLNQWLDQGAPAGQAKCSEPANEPADADDEEIDVSGLDCYKLLTFAQGNKSAKFKVGSAVDAYYVFGFRAPWQGTVYGKLIRPVIDNERVLHHWLLYREDVQDGSITPTIGNHPGGELLYGWAPGGEPMNFLKHDDVGIEMPATSYSIEVHYNSSDANAEDASGAEICVQKAEPKNIATFSWLGYDQGGTLSYATGVCLDPSDNWVGTCAPRSTDPIHILFVVPHMHQLGRHMKAVIDGPQGSRTLHDEAFDFSFQRSYAKDELLMPGETITTTCTYSEPSCAGQSTTQEMCYLFTYAYPKYALADNGPEGTFMHGQGVCLGQ